MSSLKDNLLALSSSRAASKKRQSDILDTILDISRDRAQKSALPTADTMQEPSAGSTGSGMGTPVGAQQADRLGNKGGFDASLDGPLQRLLKDFGGKVSVSSGYRSPERQAQLFSAAVKKYGSVAAARKWVAPAGKSNHGRGLAADLKYADAATREMVHRRAGDYGLAFPLSNENWHVEPIGARKK